MRIREISVTVSRTFNLGNYESLRLEAGATGELQDGDDIGAGRAALLEEARESLRAQHAAFKPKEK